MGSSPTEEEAQVGCGRGEAQMGQATAWRKEKGKALCPFEKKTAGWKKKRKGKEVNKNIPQLFLNIPYNKLKHPKLI